MKLHVLSDIHLEFGYLPPPRAEADVTVLAGDIGLGLAGAEWAREIARERPVIYVCGNHEYYRQPPVPLVQQAIKSALDGSAVRYLENESVVVDGVRFLGATLWSDFALFGDQQRGMLTAQQRMSDYVAITMERISPRGRRIRKPLQPADTLAFHCESRSWLEEELNADFLGKTVVVTHHLPSPRSLPYAHREQSASVAYASELEGLMGSARVALWIHGHVHHSCCYQMNGTHIVCNPRGYAGVALNEAFDPKLVVEID
ncbi:MAG TPA: metallophosphoesterase [Burkholderiales bacterium]|nr:metallophosphoesterase [Burkholderiales bacterium]